MLGKLEVVETKALPAAVIPVSIPRSEIRNAMGPAMQELMAQIPAKGFVPAGRIFSHHLTTEPARFEFEVGIPVAGAVTPAGRVKGGELPARKVVRTVYTGGYEGLGQAWGEFDAQVKAAGHKTTGEFWEVYTTGPESGNDPGQWQTELNMVLR
jgi:effector-binding domain-containing protein